MAVFPGLKSCASFRDSVPEQERGGRSLVVSMSSNVRALGHPFIVKLWADFWPQGLT